MGIHVAQLRKYVIQPTLKYLGMYSLAAENLLLGTAAQESKLGTYLHQVNGPALGIYQMEPATHWDLWHNYLIYHSDLGLKILGLICGHDDDEQLALKLVFMKVEDSHLITNLSYATAMTRVHYYRCSDKLPDADDIVGLANYWKKNYNTHKGAGKVEDFVSNYNIYVLGK